MPENIPTTVASYGTPDADYGFATVTFTDQVSKHNVKLPFLFEVDVDTLDAGELAWEAAGEWAEAGWGSDNPVWGVVEVTVTLPDGSTVEVD